MQPPRKAGHCAVALAALLGAAAVQAQTNPYYISASQSLGHESNLLRLATTQTAPAGFSQADKVSTTSLLAGIDQPIGRQRAYANVALRNYRYGENTGFDNTGYSATGGLDFQTVERISGSLSGSASRSLQRFNSVEINLLTQKNQESVETANGRVSVGVVTQYTLELTAGHRQVRNSLQNANVQARQFQQDNGSVGLRWQHSPAASLGVSVGQSAGRYPKFRTNAAGEYEADRFKRNDIEFTASLRPSGASSIDLRLSNGKTRYDLNQQRDFAGNSGSAAWNWQASGKLRLSAAVSRDTGQDSYAVAVFNTPTTSDYSRTTTLYRASASWDATAKINLVAGLNYYDRDLVRTIPNPVLPLDASGRERTALWTLGLRWSPLRSTQLGCDFSRENRRGSGELAADLRADVFNCFGQITLQ